jgi:hypothetical protein
MKKSVILILVVFTLFLSVIPIAQAATVTNSPSLSGIQIFPKDNIWNTRVDKLPVDAKSKIYIADLLKDTAPYSGLRHYIRNAIPYNVVTSAQRHQYISGFVYPAYADNVPFPIPANPLYELGCPDYHLEIVDVDEMMLYELSAAHKNSDGTWSGSIGAVWDLRSNRFRKSNDTPMWSANEAGIPILSGLVRYDEVSAGSINHALRISVPQMQDTWVWPARSTTLGGVTNPSHMPAGQRLRLKASYDISGYPPQAKVILQGLKTYGAMVATNNGMNLPPSIVGAPDTRWDFNDLNTLWNVPISEFEAVDVSSIMIDKNSAQARQAPGGTPSPAPAAAITVTSPDGGETWQRGTSHTITWSYTGSPGSTVRIGLLKAGTEIGTITSGTALGSSGRGSYTWPVSSDGLTGSDFMVSVQSTSQSAIRDTGNNYFTITPESSSPAPVPTPAAPRHMKVGVFNGVWKLDMNGNGTWEGPAVDRTLEYGAMIDVPLIGDWNGDGTDGIAIFRPSTGFWYFDYNLDGTVDKSFRFGGSADRIITGDWDGDGKDGIAIFRPSTGFWYFDYNLDGTVDKSFRFGGSADQIIAGDWDGNGTDGIGIFRPSTGYWYLSNTMNGTVDRAFRFGATGDIPVVGVWT